MLDRSQPLPAMSPIDARDVIEELKRIPKSILWDCEAPLKRFHLEMEKHLGYSPEWFEEMVTYMIEYVADLPSSDAMIFEYAQEVCNDYIDLAPCTPVVKEYLYGLIADFGVQLRNSLRDFGMYTDKGSLLYRFSAFGGLNGYDIHLERLDKEDVPWLYSKPPGEPGSRGRLANDAS